jgi:hypothetical protein
MTLQQILIFEQNVYLDAPQLRYRPAQYKQIELRGQFYRSLCQVTFETRIKDPHSHIPVMDGIQIGRHKLLRFQKQIEHKTGILGAGVSQ